MNSKKLRGRKRGFTLVELLVVIAIIALLLSLLMPALQKVRKQALLIVCQSNVKQLGYASQMYTQDNQNKFWMGAFTIGTATTGEPAGVTLDYSPHFAYSLFPYYKDKKLLLCPLAKKRKADGAVYPYAAWDNPMQFEKKADGTIETVLGSYGCNQYVQTCQLQGAFWGRRDDPTHYDSLWWRKTNLLQSPNKVPVIMDIMGNYYAAPTPRDTPGDRDISNIVVSSGTVTGSTSFNNMSRVSGTRHDGQIDIVFGDFSVRKVSIKELWHLNWYMKWRQRKLPMAYPDSDVLDPVWSDYKWLTKLSGQGYGR